MNKEFMKVEKLSIIKMFENKDVKLSFNTDKYDSLQVVLSNSKTGQLIWRMWDYDSDFAFYLNQELNRLKDKVIDVVTLPAKCDAKEWDNEDNAISAERESITNNKDGSFIEIMKQTLSDWFTETVLDVRYVVCFNNSYIECDTLEEANAVKDSFVALSENKENVFECVSIKYDDKNGVELCKNNLFKIGTTEILTVEYQVYINGKIKAASNNYQDMLNLYSFECAKVK